MKPGSKTLLGETALLCSEAAEVIDLRLRLLLRGGAEARAETLIMAAEKWAAASILLARLATGGLGTRPGEIASRTVHFHRHWVRANRRRLSRRHKREDAA